MVPFGGLHGAFDGGITPSEGGSIPTDARNYDFPGRHDAFGGHLLNLGGGGWRPTPQGGIFQWPTTCVQRAAHGT